MANKRQPTVVERGFLPAVTDAEKILADSGLPDVDHYVRLHPDEHWTDDLSDDLRQGERGVTGYHLAEKVYGKESDQAYAARIVYDFRRLQTAIKLGEHEQAAFLAARLADFMTEGTLGRDATRGRAFVPRGRRRGAVDALSKTILDFLRANPRAAGKSVLTHLQGKPSPVRSIDHLHKIGHVFVWYSGEKRHKTSWRTIRDHRLPRLRALAAQDQKATL